MFRLKLFISGVLLLVAGSVFAQNATIIKDDGQTEVTAGDGATYTYTITVAVDNASLAALGNATVTEDSFPTGFTMGAVTPSQGACAGPDPGGFPCVLGLISIGNSATITVDYTAPSDTPPGTQTNTVSLYDDSVIIINASSARQLDVPLDTTSDNTDVVTSADLSITKDDSETQVTAGDGVTHQYTITVNNIGPSDADNVTVTEDSFPTGFSMGTVASSQGGCAAFPCNLGTIVSGGSATITVDYTVPSDTPAGTQTNTVSVGSDEPDSVPGNNTASDDTGVLASADLSITKSDGVTAAVPGQDSIIYTIVASNGGPSNDPNATVTDTFPADLSCDWSSEAAGGATGNSSGTSPDDLNDTLSMPANSSVTYTVTCSIDPSATGTLSNTADIGASVTDPDTSNNSATDNDTLLTPVVDVSINKDNGVDVAAPGDVLVYTIAVDNAGPSTAAGMTVEDFFPPVLVDCTWVCSASAGSSCSAGPVTGDISDSITLLPGGSATYTATCDTNLLKGNFIVDNLASVSIPDGTTDLSPDNNSSSDETTVVFPVPALSLGALAGLALMLAGIGAWRRKRR